MDPNEVFKRFFGGSFPGFGEGGLRSGHEDGWSDKGGCDGHGADMFDDFHRQFQQQMEEMHKQMREVFRIFQFPKGHPEISTLPDGQGVRDSRSRSNPRDHMLKDDKETQPRAFSSREWMYQFTKIPKWNRVHPEERIDRDLDETSPSSAEVADIFKKNDDRRGELIPSHPFSFGGTSVSIQTIVGVDGVVEEKRTVRDSSGREETTVTRKIGDSSHTVTTIRDRQGHEEKLETFDNVDKVKLPEFDQQWKKRNINTEPDGLVTIQPRHGGILSDENRNIFRKFFGF